MIITQLEGGMGNQMFQYAFGKALARRFRTRLVIDTRFIAKDHPMRTSREYSLDKFHVKEMLFEDVPDDIVPEEVSLVEEEKWFKYNPDLVEAVGKNSYLVGYWQSWRYFEDVESLIRKKFRIRTENLSPDNISRGEEMSQTCSVSIHVRRTDYLKPQHSLIGALPVDYYNKAISYMAERLFRPRFYIFSDDPDWAEENIITPNTVRVVRGNSGIEDLHLMSQCRHNIIANSSFSWWAAWLNTYPEKMVTVPRIWFPGSNISITDIDLIPPGWISISS